jgi:ATP-dependent DNA ligase
MSERVELRQKHGRTNERYWIIERDDCILRTEWGALDSAGNRVRHGDTEDQILSKGKKGTAAFVGAADNAIFNMNREVRKKLEEGYSMLHGQVKMVPKTADHIDHTTELPKNLAFCKPSKKPNKKAMGRNDLFCTVKFNGETVVVHKLADRSCRIYSRRMIDITAWFPHLQVFVEASSIPPNSILLFEGFMGRGATRKDAIKAASIFRSKPELAVEKQADEVMQFYLFRVPIWDGDARERECPNGKQLTWVEDVVSPILLDKRHRLNGKRFLHPIQLHRNLSVDSALSLARENKWEGMVGYLPECSMDDQAWSFHGKPDRPTHFFKLKLDEEDDFIVRFNPDKGHGYGTWGTGKNQKRVGTLSMLQFGGDGYIHYCGEVGTGLSDDDRDKIAATLKETGKTYRGVAEVHFETRFFISEGDKSNAIQLPRIHRFRTDKDVSECVCDQLTEG